MACIEEILNIIYSYYPKDVSFNDIKYKLSVQYCNSMKKKSEHTTNTLIKKDIYSTLINALKGYEIIDWTDLSSSFCYEFRILLHKNVKILDDDIKLIKMLKGKRLDILLYVSILSNYFYFDINETKYINNKWEFRYINKLPIEIEYLTSIINQCLISLGYYGLTSDIVHTYVDHIETEYKDKGKVTVFDCLFTDLYTDS